jgi:hypothetical protein
MRIFSVRNKVYTIIYLKIRIWEYFKRTKKMLKEINIKSKFVFERLWLII